MAEGVGNTMEAARNTNRAGRRGVCCSVTGRRCRGKAIWEVRISLEEKDITSSLGF